MAVTEYNYGNDVLTVPPQPEPPFDYPARIAELERQATEAQARANRAETTLADFKQRVSDVGGKYADRHDWCSVYDEILDELDLPGRVQTWTVNVRVHATYSVDVEARSYDEAQGKVDEQTVTSMWKATQPFDDVYVGPAHSVEVETADEDGDF